MQFLNEESTDCGLGRTLLCQQEEETTKVPQISYFFLPQQQSLSLHLSRLLSSDQKALSFVEKPWPHWVCLLLYRQIS